MMKNNMLKKLLSLFLALFMLLGAAPLGGIAELDFSKLNILSGLHLPKISSLFETKASAQELITGTCGANLTWELDADNGTLTISGTGDMENYPLKIIDHNDNDYLYIDSYTPWRAFNDSISSVILENGITGICDGAFCSCYYLQSVIIPTGVTKIGRYAFYECGRLTDITIPDGVTIICDGMFMSCCNLSSINIPSGVINIGSRAFYACDGLTNIIIPDSVISIGDDAFGGIGFSITTDTPDETITLGDNAFCGIENVEYHGTASGSPWGAKTVNGFFDYPLIYTDETKSEIIGCSSSFNGSITIPNSVTRIDEGAFYGCFYLQSVTIPDSVESIGRYAFFGCRGLANTTIPDSVTSIGDYTFSHCDIQGSITIPGNATSIGSYAFCGCDRLTEVVFSTGVESIGDGMFMVCSNLSNLTIPNSITSIGKNAFFGCDGLTDIIIPDSVISIGKGAFCSTGLVNSTNVTLAPGNEYYQMIDGCLVEKSTGVLTLGFDDSVIPDDGSVTTIGANAFSFRTISDISIPDSVNNISAGAFYGCSELKTITIGSEVRAIGFNAFYGCTDITDIYYSGSYSEWWSVSVSGGNECLHRYLRVTRLRGCCGGDATGGNILYYLYNNGLLALRGAGQMEDYSAKSHAPWYSDRAYIREVDIGNGIENIGSYAFNGCPGISNVTIPGSVTAIGDYAFSGCSVLQSITIPENVASIGRKAFYNCSMLTTLNYNAVNCTVAGNYFQLLLSHYHWLYGCHNLTKINIGNSVEVIPDYAFAGCKKLTGVTIPSGVTTIGECAFRDCIRLESITLPEGLLSIGKNALSPGTSYIFSNTLSSRIVSVDIPDSVTTIGDNAFSMVCNVSYNPQAMTATGAPWGAHSVNGYVDGYLVYSDAGKTELRACSNAAAGEISLPGTVTTINSKAFYNCTRVTTINIPNSVTSIGVKAFYNVPNIRHSDLMTADGSPWGAKNVDAYIENGLVYYDDSKTVLTAVLPDAATDNGAVTVPGTVREVGDGAFSGCDFVTEVTFESEDIIDYSATSFADCENLTTVNSPNTEGGITFMLDEPYAYHKAAHKLVTAKAPAKSRVAAADYSPDLTGLNGILFCNRSKSGTYTVPDYITYICDNAFANCTDLTVNLDNCTLERIGRNAFLNCKNYKSWNQSGLFRIGNYLISAASSLASLEVPADIALIADGAFEKFSSLASVSFAGSFPRIGRDAFKDTAFVNDTSNWDNGALYIGGQLVRAAEDYTGAFAVRAGTVSIAAGAFANCAGITSVTIPASVTQIGDNAFENCSALTTVTMGSGVETIGNYAFRDCSSLGSISIPASTVKIGDFAFMNCDSLASFNVSAENAYYKSADGVLFSKNGASLIQYPAGKAYRSVYDVNAIDGCERIESFAFRNCENIGNVFASVRNKENPGGTIVLGYRNSFARSETMFNNGYVIIQGTILKGWTDAASAEFTVPAGIKSIGANAFEGRTNLTSITFNSGLELINEDAFYGCTGLTSVSFPASLQEIGSGAFEGCVNLSSVTFALTDGAVNENLKTVGMCAFAGCSDNIVFINRDALNLESSTPCAFGHGRAQTTVSETAPTCTSPGSRSVSYTCSECGKSGVYEKEIPALGHTFLSGSCIRCHLPLEKRTANTVTIGELIRMIFSRIFFALFKIELR